MSATYVNDRQRVRFTIKVITKKDDYLTALQTPRLHVIYLGHARYGRGPCFGDVSPHGTADGRCDEPGENWGRGDPAYKYGSYRMGFPYIAVPVHELIKHGYKTHLVETDRKMESSQCHPTLRRELKRLRRYTLDELDSKGRLPALMIGPPAADARFWGFTSGKAINVVHYAGWGKDMDWEMDRADANLAATDLKCRVFCHFGCSTFIHNYPILRNRMKWQRSETERFAYWTRAPSNGLTTPYWIYNLLTYPNRNDFESWYPSLRDAVRRTNRDLRKARQRFSIV